MFGNGVYNSADGIPRSALQQRVQITSNKFVFTKLGPGSHLDKATRSLARPPTSKLATSSSLLAGLRSSSPTIPAALRSRRLLVSHLSLTRRGVAEP